MAFFGDESEVLDITIFADDRGIMRIAAEMRETLAEELVGQILKVLCGRRHCLCVGDRLGQLLFVVTCSLQV